MQRKSITEVSESFLFHFRFIHSYHREQRQLRDTRVLRIATGAKPRNTIFTFKFYLYGDVQLSMARRLSPKQLSYLRHEKLFPYKWAFSRDPRSLVRQIMIYPSRTWVISLLGTTNWGWQGRPHYAVWQKRAQQQRFVGSWWSRPGGGGVTRCAVSVRL